MMLNEFSMIIMTEFPQQQQCNHEAVRFNANDESSDEHQRFAMETYKLSTSPKAKSHNV